MSGSGGSGAGAIPRSGTSGSDGFASSAGAPARGMAAAAAGTAPGGGGGSGGGGAGGEAPLTASQLLATRGMSKRLTLSKKMSAANNNTGPLKGKRFDLMALPMNPGQQDRRERDASEHAETTPSESPVVTFMNCRVARWFSVKSELGRCGIEHGRGGFGGSPRKKQLSSVSVQQYHGQLHCKCSLPVLDAALPAYKCRRREETFKSFFKSTYIRFHGTSTTAAPRHIMVTFGLGLDVFGLLSSSWLAFSDQSARKGCRSRSGLATTCPRRNTE